MPKPRDSQLTDSPGSDPQPRSSYAIDETPALATRKAFELWGKEKSTPDWLLAGTAAGNRWAIGREVTEAEFDAAVHKAANTPMR